MYRYLERELKQKYTCEAILEKLRSMDFVSVQEQGYTPLFEKDELSDALHETVDFRLDNEFITKLRMREIQKKSKCR